MARNRPRVGEIGRESGQKDEENTWNPKKALPGPENGIQGLFFALFVFWLRGHFFEISRGRRIKFVRLVCPYFFV